MIFLHKCAPEKEKPQTYFNHPLILVAHIDAIEKEALFLITLCEDLANELNDEEKTIKNKIDIAHKQEERLNKFFQEIENIEPFTYNFPDNISSLYDDQMEKLAILINNTFFACLQKNSDIKAISKLELVENKLEEMYKIIDLLSPQYLKEKQNEMDKRRREIARIEKQNREEEISRQKILQSMERAQHPVRLTDHRPLKKRILPLKKKRNTDDSAKILAALREQELLYGEINDE